MHDVVLFYSSLYRGYLHMTLAVLVCKQGRQVHRMYIRKGGLLKIAKANRGAAAPTAPAPL